MTVHFLYILRRLSHVTGCDLFHMQRTTVDELEQTDLVQKIGCQRFRDAGHPLLPAERRPVPFGDTPVSSNGGVLEIVFD